MDRTRPLKAINVATVKSHVQICLSSQLFGPECSSDADFLLQGGEQISFKMSAQKSKIKGKTQGLLKLCIHDRAGQLGLEKRNQSSAIAEPYFGGAVGASGVCRLQQWGEKAGAIPGCCPVMGTPPVVASNQWWVCKPPALLTLFSAGGDISTGWGLGVVFCCELTLRCLAWASPWGHTTVSTPALGKVSVHPMSLQHAGKQPWLLQLLLSRFPLPAPGQGCPWAAAHKG